MPSAPPTSSWPGRVSRIASIPATGLQRALAGDSRFDDGAGTTVRDQSAARRDCRLHGLDARRSWVPGLHAGALELEHGWVECPQPPVAATVATPMSVALWVNAIALSSSHTALVSRQLGKGPADYFFLGTIGSG